MRKHFLVILLGTLLLFAFVGSAETSVSADGEFTYTKIADGACIITGYQGTAADLIIPEVLDGYKVTEIGDGALSNRFGLVSVTISEGVLSIADGALTRCWDLASVSIPGTVTSIGVWAFSQCPHLAAIVISQSVETIGAGAYGACRS